MSVQKKLAREQRDSLKKLPTKINKSMLLFKVGFTTGGVNFNNNNTSIIFQGGMGAGMDVTVGFKAHKHLAMGFGGNYMSCRLNKKLVDQSTENYFFDYDYTTIDTSASAGSINKSSVYFYASYWYYRPKFIFELYTKLSVAYTDLKLYNVIYRHKTFSNYSEYFLMNKPNSYLSFLPSVGVCGSLPINKILYASLSAEYGYYINQYETMQLNHYASDGKEDIYKLNVPKAAHVFQVNAGVMIRAFNRVHGHERRYNQDVLDKVNEKNN